MIKLKLMDRERTLIYDWIENMREGAERYGGWSVVFPEEAMVEEKLRAPSREISFTRHQLELILDWAEASAISDAEKLLMARVKGALEQNP